MTEFNADHRHFRTWYLYLYLNIPRVETVISGVYECIALTIKVRQ